MGIPKYILHPLLLLSGAGLILWLVWSRIPSAEEMREKAAAIPAAAALPERMSLIAIEDFDEAGRLIAEDGRSFVIDDGRFQNPSGDALGKLRAFFVGKLLDPAKAADGTFHLPIELYDPLCFKTADKTPVHCPVVLQK